MNPPILQPFISGRYSPFAFSERVITHDELMLIFEAAGKAPSSFNNQPWAFAYAARSEPALYQLFFDCLLPGNRIWAHTAPVLALTLVRKSYVYNNKENHMSRFEAGLAVGNLIFQAMSMGIYVHQMGGYDKELARARLDIPDDFDTLTMMALGYPGDVSSLPPDVYKRASVRTSRKAVHEYVFKGRYTAL